MTAPTSKGKRSIFRKLFKGLVITIAALFTLAVLVTVYENWSGAREWKKVHEMLIAENVELDLR